MALVLIKCQILCVCVFNIYLFDKASIALALLFNVEQYDFFVAASLIIFIRLLVPIRG